MKPLPLLALAILWQFIACAQSNTKGQIKGRVVDTDSKTGLSGAVLTLLVAKDSSRTSYIAISDDGGFFLFPEAAEGNYKLFVSYLGYDSKLLAENITLSTGIVTVHDILLKRKSVILSQVEIVETKPPIRFKKDTIEFRADYYKVKGTSPMESLLKKLPGVEITPEGLIKYNGEIVQYILIDGKPFFGSDTRQATQNLLSGIVEKIQIIDREIELSRQDTHSGITKEKVLNINLKKDQYNKIGGLVSVGGGFNKIYTFKGNINHFTACRHISIITGGNNINDYNDEMYLSNSLLTMRRAGIDYNYDLNKKLNLAFNYYFSNPTIFSKTETNRQNFFPDSISYFNQSSVAISDTKTNGGTLDFVIKLDSSSILYIKNSLILKSKYEQLNNSYRTTSMDKLINNGVLDNELKGNTLSYGSSVNFIRRFKQPGQLLQLSVNYFHSDAENISHNTSNTTYFLPNGLGEHDSTNQNLNDNSISVNYKASAIYSMPIHKKVILSLSYNINKTESLSKKNVYQFNSNSGKYDDPIDSLGGDIQNNLLLSNYQIGLGIHNPNYDISIGINLISNNQSTEDRVNKFNYAATTNKLYPKITFNYVLSDNEKILIDYSKRIQVPTISQLYPIPDNSNPLSIQIGNSNLKPSGIDQVTINYQKINAANSRMVFINSNIGIVSNQIINSINSDSLGRQILKPINVTGGYFGGISFYGSFSILNKRATLITASSFNIGKDYSSINGIVSSLSKTNISQSIRFDYSYKELFEISTLAGINSGKVRNSIQSNFANRYTEYLLSVEGKIALPKGTDFKVNTKYATISGGSDSFNKNRLTVNISATKSFFSKNQGLVKIQVYDLLNNNGSIARNTAVGYIEDIQTMSISRFTLFSFSYFFNQRKK